MKNDISPEGVKLAQELVEKHKKVAYERLEARLKKQNEELEPCKCGKTPKIKQKKLPDGNTYFHAAHKCTDELIYDIQHSYYRTKELAIAAWNKRVTEGKCQ